MPKQTSSIRGKGCPYGSHRAAGGLPQPAEVLDTRLPIHSNEILIDVELLNIDSSSLRQISEECDGKLDRIKSRILEIVRRRGKMHNPVTRSGGVLVGRVLEIGNDYPAQGVVVGDRICPIVSLSLVPLSLTEIKSIDLKSNQMEARGKAILFESAVFGKLPDDFPLPLSVALIDICGAPARLALMAKPGDTVGILGAGKAGLVSAYAAREMVGREGRVLIADIDRRMLDDIASCGVADAVIQVDLKRPLDALHQIEKATSGTLCDIVVSVTNVPDTEGAAILATRQKGRTLLFGMANTFQVAALSAEGVGRDIEMIIGNGYVEGCIDNCFALVRRHPALRSVLEKRLLV
ncbi:MAG TPA: L-erythro-3,5-diaminohexanoate dehydrogenase [Alphaproteobacteria bacterium]|nr:L-erythro-3,5-diaminohexanoate dehydrogenase [Alphaproteobacteria bacterium]